MIKFIHILKKIIPFLLVVLSITYRDRLGFLFYNFFTSNVPDINVYTVEQLALYNGISKNKIYLSIIGSVFDVTTGKDGSRAFVTGDFKDESLYKDHILDLPCNDLLTLKNWKDTLRDKYKEVGVLIGRYYDVNGRETEYMKMFYVETEKCIIEKDLAKKEELKFPPCNIEWSPDAGTKVWCTKTSGGVKRNWVGVPRQLYTPGQDMPRCTCVNIEDIDNSAAMFKEYDNCPITSTSCIIKSN
ncbi:neuferricin homolog isoform X2 [Achroia grisella]|uniref:neuferricin homolog isoform X2 n=1 Tax=Achroia grisella TaxID=688607 RepID=UPI0027D34965|nr:neuferricin homolog isoform X2 [Achroia grisella]